MVEMSERDKFMLDLNGFLVVEVSALRQPIGSQLHMWSPALRPYRAGDYMSYSLRPQSSSS